MDLRLAIPSTGALHDPAMSFLESCGLAIVRSSSRSYRGEIPAIAGLVVHFQRAADIAMSVENGSSDLGIVGMDDFLEKRREGGNSEILIAGLGFGHCEVVVGVPDFWVDVTSVADLADLSTDLKGQGDGLLRVATKFPRLTERFLLENGFNYFSIRQASGALEAAPLMGSADVIVDISETGTTMRENRIKTIHGGTVLASEACLIGNRAHLAESIERSDSARELVVRIESRLDGAGP